MLPISSHPELKVLADRVMHHAGVFGRILPEIRFFILDSHEFTSLLNKNVYPVSPVNIWEGKANVSQRHRQETGQESSLYYEVVQTGRPSYAYLNDTNSATMQASVMAHVVGHCEFSELNVMHDANDDRTEMIIYLTRKVERSRQQMGDLTYSAYWNAVESMVPLLAPNSQHNLEGTIDTEAEMAHLTATPGEAEEAAQSRPLPYSSTLATLFGGGPRSDGQVLEQERKRKARQQTLSRKGYKLRAPCQDVLGFLRQYAPTSAAERTILDYIYTAHKTHDFVRRTQIMNEGWAMYWEKKIMMELFKERACPGIIEYTKSVAGVCYPRPWYQRNPYSLGFHLWNHIEALYRDGKVSLAYTEETNLNRKIAWKRDTGVAPLDAMRHLVRTCTDYEFLRRFLTPEIIEATHLNRVPKAHLRQLGLDPREIIRESQHHVWVNPGPLKNEMLTFFTHFHQPRIYIIDTDYMDGGLLLLHRDDSRPLRQAWISPTLKNLNLLWKGPVALLSRDTLYSFSANSYKETRTPVPSFEVVSERLLAGDKPFRI